MYIVYYFVLNIFLYNSSLHARYFSHLHEGATHVALYSIFSITNEYSALETQAPARLLTVI